MARGRPSAAGGNRPRIWLNGALKKCEIEALGMRRRYERRNVLRHGGQRVPSLDVVLASVEEIERRVNG